MLPASVRSSGGSSGNVARFLVRAILCPGMADHTRVSDPLTQLILLLASLLCSALGVLLSMYTWAAAQVERRKVEGVGQSGTPLRTAREQQLKGRDFGLLAVHTVILWCSFVPIALAVVLTDQLSRKYP